MVANGPEHSLVSLDPSDGSVSYVTRLRGDATSSVPVAAGKQGVWFADATGRMVGQVDLSGVGGGAPSTEIQVPPNEESLLSTYQSFDGLAVGEGAIWVAGDAFGRTVWKLDRSSSRVILIELPFVPAAIAAGEGAVWVTSLLGDAVARIDPATNRIVATIPVGRGVDGIATGEGAVWVASSIARVVSRIDPRTDHVAARVRMAGAPTHIAIGAGGVWVTVAQPAPPVPRGAVGIGVLADCIGPFGSWYNQSIAGAELALPQHDARRAGPRLEDGVTGARIGGKPVTLVLGCTDQTAASVIREARRLVEQAHVRILIGATGGWEGVALQEYARLQPGVAFVSALSGAQELSPPRNVFSFNPDGAEWMAGLGAYAYRTLGWRRAVTLGDLAQGVFNWAQIGGFIGEFCSLGGTIVKRIWVSAGTQDYSSVVGQIPGTGVDGIVAATGPQTLLALVRGYQGLHRNISRKLILGANTGGPALGQLGPGSSGLLLAGSWLSTAGATGKRYQAELRKRFPHLGPAIVWDIAYHDAMAATVAALTAVHGDLSGGERKFMGALARVRLDSPTGLIRLDSSRQAIGPNYLVRLNGTLYRRINGVEHTFGGYFMAHDPPPSETSPVCVMRTPPLWAR
jgi:branched-chain amino acid transport system substrate-binding protein